LSATASFPLSLHDALPICELGLDSITMIELYCRLSQRFTDLEQHVDRLRGAKTVGELVELLEALAKPDDNPAASAAAEPPPARADRKSTRLNSSHQIISYA